MTPDLARNLATYNHWQNQLIYAAANELSDSSRRANRGAFFGSIHATLDHLIWADQIWLSRFGGCAAPGGSIASSVGTHANWADLQAERLRVDSNLVQWAEALKSADLQGEMSWFSGAAQRQVKRPISILVAHMFNHQTHHRGQVHAMLTAAGANGPVSDLFLAPQFN